MGRWLDHDLRANLSLGGGLWLPNYIHNVLRRRTRKRRLRSSDASIAQRDPSRMQAAGVGMKMEAAEAQRQLAHTAEDNSSDRMQLGRLTRLQVWSTGLMWWTV